MPQVPLRVIREPVRPTLTRAEQETLDRMMDHEFVRGPCGAALITGVQVGTVFGLVIRCAACQALNATEPA